MKYTYLLLLYTILFCIISCTEENHKSTVQGSIDKIIDKGIVIGNQNIPVSKNGEFKTIIEIKTPTLLDVAYSGKEWTVFIEPGCEINIVISETDSFKISYTGNLVQSNNYLLKTSSISQTVNSFFNNNWISLHSKSEAEFISQIDSLKNLYLNHLESYFGDNKTDSDKFIKTWKAELDYSFNSLIISYPSRHFQLTQKETELSPEAILYLNSSSVDEPEYFGLPSYKRFTKEWISYQTDLLADKDSTAKHFNLKKTEYAFQIIPEMFESNFLIDYWLTEVLKEHIERNRLGNSHEFINLFNNICKTDKFQKEIQAVVNSIHDQRSNHDVLVYKTENDFNLEAHIFKPENLKGNEKRPLIILIHGGGWNGGNPSWAFGRAKHFRDLGMIAIAGQYRLTNEHDITAVEAMADIRDLIKWARLNSDSLNIMSDRIVAYGWSAGAHLITSSAIFSDSIPGKFINSVPNAMILISPAVSLPKGEGWEVWKFNVFGANTTVSSANPVEHICEDLPPTIIVQGRDDTVTPLDGVQLFHERMLKNDNYCELYIYDGVGHLFTPNTMPDNRIPQPNKEVQGQAYKQIDSFLIKFGYIKEN